MTRKFTTSHYKRFAIAFVGSNARKLYKTKMLLDVFTVDVITILIAWKNKGSQKIAYFAI